MKYDIGTPHGPMVVTLPRAAGGMVTLTPGVPVTVVQAPAILHTPEGVPYSNDPAIMAALDLRHRIGFAEGAEHVASVLSEGFMEEQHEMSPEQEDGYQHAVSDAHDVARGKREHAAMGIRHTTEARARRT